MNKNRLEAFSDGVMANSDYRLYIGGNRLVYTGYKG
jgi:hypothetical protein